MFHNFRRLWFLIIAVSFALHASPLAAQLFRGHWYHDPLYPAISSLSATRAMIFSGTVTCLPTIGLTSTSISSPSTIILMPAMSANGVIVAYHMGHSHHVEPRNAILKLWVPDDLEVVVNGKVTKSQSLAGKHRNSRIFSLAGLKYEDNSCEIVIYEPHGKKAKKYSLDLPVDAGGSYDVRYPRDFKNISVVRHHQRLLQRKSLLKKLEKVAKTVKKARNESKEAQTAAENAKNAAEQASKAAQQHEQNAKAEADKAKKAAIQVASLMNGEFEFQTTKDQGRVRDLGAYVKYAEDGSVAKFIFEKPTTFKKLEFKETSGALAEREDVKVKINYYFKFKSSDSTPIEFKLKAQTTMFKNGHASVDFFDPKNPNNHLSAEFRKLLMEKLAKRYAKVLIHVEIRAQLPNGSPVQVTPKGKPITIQLKTLTE